MYLNYIDATKAQPCSTYDCLLLLADGSHPYGWYSPITNRWYAYDYYNERSLREVSSQVIAWVSLSPEKGEPIQCRRTRKNNSWFNQVAFNN